MIKERVEIIFQRNGFEIVRWKWNRQWRTKKLKKGARAGNNRPPKGVIVGAVLRLPSGKVISVSTFGGETTIRKELTKKLATTDFTLR